MTKPDYFFSCPVGGALEVFAGRWKPEILWQLKDGPVRFTKILRAIDGVSQKMLTQQLRELQRDGLVVRKQYEEIPPRVEYSATELVQTLIPIFDVMIKWSDENATTVINKRIQYDKVVGNIK